MSCECWDQLQMNKDQSKRIAKLEAALGYIGTVSHEPYIQTVAKEALAATGPTRGGHEVCPDCSHSNEAEEHCGGPWHIREEHEDWENIPNTNVWVRKVKKWPTS